MPAADIDLSGRSANPPRDYPSLTGRDRRHRVAVGPQCGWGTAKVVPILSDSLRTGGLRWGCVTAPAVRRPWASRNGVASAGLGKQTRRGTTVCFPRPSSASRNIWRGVATQLMPRYTASALLVSHPAALGPIHGLVLHQVRLPVGHHRQLGAVHGGVDRVGTF
jgi:hypothetical protein